jgi:hypothetical protein
MGVIIHPQNTDMHAFIYLENGTVRKQEIYKGNSYLSQSGQYIQKIPGIKKVEVLNSKREKSTF